MNVVFAIVWILWMIAAWTVWQSMTEEFGFYAFTIPVMICVCVSFVLAYLTCKFWWLAILLIIILIKNRH